MIESCCVNVEQNDPFDDDVLVKNVKIRRLCKTIKTSNRNTKQNHFLVQRRHKINKLQYLLLVMHIIFRGDVRS